MRLLRKIKIKKVKYDYIYHTTGSILTDSEEYSVITDSALLSYAEELSEKYSCEIAKYKIDKYDISESTLVIKGSKKNFIKFCIDFSKYFNKEIHIEF